MANFLKGTQNGRFWPKCRGGTLCKNLEIGHFFGRTLKGFKIVNTSRMDAEFILVFTDAKISVKPLAFWPKWPIFMAQLCKARKIGKTYRILVKMVLLDAKFILLFIDTKTSKNKSLLAEKLHLCDEYPKCLFLIKNVDRLP